MFSNKVHTLGASKSEMTSLSITPTSQKRESTNADNIRFISQQQENNIAEENQTRNGPSLSQIQPTTDVETHSLESINNL